jgi:hypothetical protein
MNVLIIPRYYYLGKAEDTMRDPRSLSLSYSLNEAYRKSTIEWDTNETILLMWDQSYNLLGVRDITKDLNEYAAWRKNEQYQIYKNFPDDDQHFGAIASTVQIARSIAFRELGEKAQMYLDNISFKAMAAQCKS